MIYIKTLINSKTLIYDHAKHRNMTSQNCISKIMLYVLEDMYTLNLTIKVIVGATFGNYKNDNIMRHKDLLWFN